ncbi:metal ABC transporter solute-binding protein, Zn/Mn family [Salinisphaera sp. Q1T1-3]|uniref:metal ABC transporter solute-binding protein, Zn/Mn family n=1 Tax=Salinisphaera sp. Q1T1-3 TaxID=2321229 RepID=UPI000E76EE54|nr:zinc ABC transporter substrate-binding protein [Salinisphaera sp. Q1T1-3]RJS95141.1 metal ABC transporter substrate-binding protein [Salinisphaera sp. Q1T1-3]
MLERRFVIALIIALGLAGYGGTAAARTVDAVASFTVLADVVKQVGGDHVDVKSLVPPNGDPHTYAPTPQDSKALQRSDVAFVSGDGLETWFSRLAAAAAGGKSPVVVSKGIVTHQLAENGHEITAPHVWNSVENVRIWVRNIRNALIRVDPDHADTFRANAARYDNKLQALNAEIHAALAPIPRDQRKVLTDHDAFGYYGREYHVTFLAPVGLSTASEPSAQTVARLIDQIRKDHIQTYFIENSNNSRLVEEIGPATGARPGGALYPEALSDEDGPAPTYIAMMRHNTQLIVDALRESRGDAAS